MGSYSIRNVGIVNELDRMEKEMQFMKTRQFVGRKTLATKVSKAGVKILSQDAWFNQPIGAPQLQALQHEVTFKADRQTSPYGVLMVEFYDISENLIVNASSSTNDGPGIANIYNIITYVDDGTLKWQANPACIPLGRWWTL